MTLQEMLAAALAKRAAAEAKRASAKAEIESITKAAEAEARTALNEAEEQRTGELLASVQTARAEVDQLDTRITALRAEIEADERVDAQLTETRESAPRPTGGARITSEPTTYRKGGDHSYFRDLFKGTVRGERASLERLARSDQEVRADQQQRALTTTDGAGGEFVPPLWLVNEFIELTRAGRVVADQIRHQALPPGTDTISIPKLATGTAVGEQATQNTAIQNTDATTTSITANVATLAGQQVISQQLLDQSPINMDDILLADLAADYAIKLDVFVINNNAAGKLGLLNVSGVNAVTYTDVSPTVSEIWPKFADAISQVHTGRLMPPDKAFMHPRRWAWFTSGLDASGRPLIGASGPQNAIGTSGAPTSQGWVANIQGVDIYVDPNIPINLGAGTNEDRIIILRSSDVILFEGSPRAEASIHPNFANLSVNLRFFNYVALHASRLPKAISVISGTGLVTPTF